MVYTSSRLTKRRKRYHRPWEENHFNDEAQDYFLNLYLQQKSEIHLVCLTQYFMANFLILRLVSSSAVSENRELSRKCVIAIKSSSSSSGMSVVEQPSSMVSLPCEGKALDSRYSRQQKKLPKNKYVGNVIVI